MLLDIIKGFLIGICASAPLGPIAIYVIRKSLSDGHRAGFLAGLGACLVDTLFSVLAIFALALTERFIGEHRTFIYIVGGLVVALLGASMTFRDPFRKLTQDEGPSYSVKDFLKAAAMGLSNPGAIFVIFALFAFFGIELEPHDFRVAPIILSVSLGSASWWFMFSLLFSKLRTKVNMGTLLWISRILGVIVLIIGIALLAEGLAQVIFQ